MARRQNNGVPRKIVPIVAAQDEAELQRSDGRILKAVLVGEEIPGVGAYQRVSWSHITTINLSPANRSLNFLSQLPQVSGESLNHFRIRLDDVLLFVNIVLPIVKLVAFRLLLEFPLAQSHCFQRGDGRPRELELNLSATARTSC